MEPDMFILFVVVFFVSIAAFVFKRRLDSADRCLSYESSMELFTPEERTFLSVIESVLENSDYRVFGKVHLGDIVKPRKGMGKNRYAAAQNKIDSKHVHFVVCRRDDLSVIAAIEFENKSREARNLLKNSKEADDVFTSVKIPYLRITAQKGYALSEVREKLAAVGVEVDRCMSITEQMRTRPWSQLMPATGTSMSHAR